MRKIIISLLILTSHIFLGQNKKFENWSENEKSQYIKLFNLAKYVDGKTKHEISKDSLFSEYIFFDYVLNDNNTERRKRRLELFDTIFYRFRKTIDTFGVRNLDAKPIRFFKNHEIYEPFREDLAKESISGEKMYYKTNSNVFAYYKKEDAENLHWEHYFFNPKLINCSLGL